MLEGPALAGTLGSLGAGLATAVGALPVLGFRRPTERHNRLMLGFAAGVMLAASFFSLIIPALELAKTMIGSRTLASAGVVAAVLTGASCLALLDRAVPEYTAPAGDRPSMPRPVWLMVTAITLHNIPEGAAVGMSFFGGSWATGISTSIGIGTQNIPEGLAVSCLLLTAGLSRLTAFAGGVASGLVEPVAGFASALLVTHVRMILPWGLSAAAGAMLLIIMAHLLPEATRERGAMAAVFAGLGIMLLLDTAMG